MAVLFLVHHLYRNPEPITLTLALCLLQVFFTISVIVLLYLFIFKRLRHIFPCFAHTLLLTTNCWEELERAVNRGVSGELISVFTIVCESRDNLQ